ncbi:UbiA family prenyltransferase [Mycobacterium shottsii]|uniref:UbiA family prenyltransferase n=1 Tax=Mycobacterium shottsii TaxID=133549 RepID=UPI001E44570E|nr:UbiA family prenyltransferase [Mycobacterium shottsii]
MRAPAALTVLGDSVVGAMWSGRPLGGRRLALPLASALLYWSGMVLNDWADRKRDAVERPERPIPSGDVSPAAATVLAAAGVAAATAAGGRQGLAAAGRITLCVVAYDVAAKDTAAGPLVMSGCRFFDVMLGAAPHYRRALIPASVIGLHTTAITVLSRSEVTGSDRRMLALVGGAAAAVATSAVAAAAGGPAGYRVALPVAVYSWAFGPSLWNAWQQPTAEAIRSAVRSGIASMIAAQAMLAARSPRSRTMLALCGLAIFLRLKVSAPKPTEVT